jgi:hypothetical protein
MSMKPLSTPAAIVIAGSLLSVAVFFGLQSSSPSMGNGDGNNSPSTGAQVQRLGPATASVAPIEQQSAAALRAEVERALEPARARILAECWKPSVARDPSPSRVAYVLSFTFDADGHQRARGMFELEGGSRPDIGACISQIPPLTITPPGRRTSVEVSFALP